MKKTKRKKSKKKNRSDSSDDDEDSEDDGNNLLSLLTSASKPSSSKKKKKKRRSQMMTVVTLMSTISEREVSMAMLHSKNVVGIDTDASMFVSTCKQHFIPGLLDASPAYTNRFQFDSAGAGSRTAREIDHAVVCTVSTEDGKPYFLIDSK